VKEFLPRSKWMVWKVRITLQLILPTIPQHLMRPPFYVKYIGMCYTANLYLFFTPKDLMEFGSWCHGPLISDIVPVTFCYCCLREDFYYSRSARGVDLLFPLEGRRYGGCLFADLFFCFVFECY